jgi:hydroxymethylpyrimidine pyrophosphatase-like HAD family hydrolase
MIIAVDFDGTIVTHEYPKIGKEIPFAIQTLKMLKNDGHRLILWSVREGQLLEDAVKWCSERGVEFYAVNKDYPEEEKANNNHFSRKLKADVWIDDRNVGGLPDWGTIYRIIKERKTYEEVLNDNIPAEEHICKKRKWWQF